MSVGRCRTGARGEEPAGGGVGLQPPAPCATDLEEVFRREYPRVVAVAARVLGSRDEAEDVAQEVFLAFGRSAVPAAEARAGCRSRRRTPR